MTQDDEWAGIKYYHVFDISFGIMTPKEDGHKVTADELRVAATARIASLDDEDMLRAVTWRPDRSVGSRVVPERRK